MFPQPQLQPVFLDDFLDDAGMMTPELSILTIVGAAFAGVLLWIVQSEGVRQKLADMIQQAFSSTI